uniref:Uncharacterized protein n=1 Tax=Hyaloperonospora arabidopsidis (strain Emoy2) TaxID=559515 RepID=M4BZ33_HYAAE
MSWLRNQRHRTVALTLTIPKFSQSSLCNPILISTASSPFSGKPAQREPKRGSKILRALEKNYRLAPAWFRQVQSHPTPRLSLFGCNGFTQTVVITRYIGVVHTERDQCH